MWSVWTDRSLWPLKRWKQHPVTSPQWGWPSWRFPVLPVGLVGRALYRLWSLESATSSGWTAAPPRCPYAPGQWDNSRDFPVIVESDICDYCVASVVATATAPDCDVIVQHAVKTCSNKYNQELFKTRGTFESRGKWNATLTEICKAGHNILKVNCTNKTCNVLHMLEKWVPLESIQNHVGPCERNTKLHQLVHVYNTVHNGK